MEEAAIYEDLPPFVLDDEVEKLREQNEIFQAHITSLERDVELLCKEIVEMKKTQDNLTRNISELFKTAKAEIERKDKIIADLRKRVDDFLFKRNNQGCGVKRNREDTSSPIITNEASAAKKMKYEEGSGRSGSSNGSNRSKHSESHIPSKEKDNKEHRKQHRDKNREDRSREHKSSHARSTTDSNGSSQKADNTSKEHSSQDRPHRDKSESRHKHRQHKSEKTEQKHLHKTLDRSSKMDENDSKKRIRIETSQGKGVKEDKKENEAKERSETKPKEEVWRTVDSTDMEVEETVAMGSELRTCYNKEDKMVELKEAPKITKTEDKGPEELLTIKRQREKSIEPGEIISDEEEIQLEAKTKQKEYKKVERKVVKPLNKKIREATTAKTSTEDQKNQKERKQMKIEHMKQRQSETIQSNRGFTERKENKEERKALKLENKTQDSKFGTSVAKSSSAEVEKKAKEPPQARTEKKNELQTGKSQINVKLTERNKNKEDLRKVVKPETKNTAGSNEVKTTSTDDQRNQKERAQVKVKELMSKSTEKKIFSTEVKKEDDKGTKTTVRKAKEPPHARTEKKDELQTGKTQINIKLIEQNENKEDLRKEVKPENNNTEEITAGSSEVKTTSTEDQRNQKEGAQVNVKELLSKSSERKIFSTDDKKEDDKRTKVKVGCVNTNINSEATVTEAKEPPQAKTEKNELQTGKSQINIKLTEQNENKENLRKVVKPENKNTEEITAGSSEVNTTSTEDQRNQKEGAQVKVKELISKSSERKIFLTEGKKEDDEGTTAKVGSVNTNINSEATVTKSRPPKKPKSKIEEVTKKLFEKFEEKQPNCLQLQEKITVHQNIVLPSSSGTMFKSTPQSTFLQAQMKEDVKNLATLCDKNKETCKNPQAIKEEKNQSDDAKEQMTVINEIIADQKRCMDKKRRKSRHSEGDKRPRHSEERKQPKAELLSPLKKVEEPQKHEERSTGNSTESLIKKNKPETSGQDTLLAESVLPLTEVDRKDDSLTVQSQLGMDLKTDQENKDEITEKDNSDSVRTENTREKAASEDIKPKNVSPRKTPSKKLKGRTKSSENIKERRQSTNHPVTDANQENEVSKLEDVPNICHLDQELERETKDQEENKYDKARLPCENVVIKIVNGKVQYPIESDEKMQKVTQSTSALNQNLQQERPCEKIAQTYDTGHTTEGALKVESSSRPEKIVESKKSEIKAPKRTKDKWDKKRRSRSVGNINEKLDALGEVLPLLSTQIDQKGTLPDLDLISEQKTKLQQESNDPEKVAQAHASDNRPHLWEKSVESKKPEIHSPKRTKDKREKKRRSASMCNINEKIISDAADEDQLLPSTQIDQKGPLPDLDLIPEQKNIKTKLQQESKDPEKNGQGHATMGNDNRARVSEKPVESKKSAINSPKRMKDKREKKRRTSSMGNINEKIIRDAAEDLLLPSTETDQKLTVPILDPILKQGNKDHVAEVNEPEQTQKVDTNELVFPFYDMKNTAKKKSELKTQKTNKKKRVSALAERTTCIPKTSAEMSQKLEELIIEIPSTRETSSVEENGNAKENEFHVKDNNTRKGPPKKKEWKILNPEEPSKENEELQINDNTMIKNSPKKREPRILNSEERTTRVLRSATRKIIEEEKSKVLDVSSEEPIEKRQNTSVSNIESESTGKTKQMFPSPVKPNYNSNVKGIPLSQILTVNLTHEGAIPELHIEEISHNNSTIFDCFELSKEDYLKSNCGHQPFSTSTPATGRILTVDLVKDDLNTSSFESGNNSTLDDSGKLTVKTPNTSGSARNASSSRKKRRCVIKMID